MSARARLVLFAFFVIATLAPLRALQDYDYFWHLATGRWIHEHGALPRTDPFGAASDPGPWINGEWLFQWLVYPLHAAFGANGIVAARALFLGVLFTLLLGYTARESKSLGLALGVCTFAWFAAVWAFSERPATFAAGLAVTAVWLTLGEPAPRRIAAYALLTIVWINFHPSALLAPVIAIIGWPSVRRAVMAGVSAVALLVNPYGIEAILAPPRLVHWVTTGPFRNIEWQPAMPWTHPPLYVMIALGLAAFGFDRERRRHLPNLVLLLLFSALAIRFLRNHGLFYATWPMVIAPMLPPLTDLRLQRIAGGAAFAFLLFFAATHRIRIGLDEEKLPVRAAAQLQASHPRGNIFAASQYGGYLIWTFYPERRVVNDGRNELYHAFLTEYAAARRDSRAWRQLLDKYRVGAALVNHEPPLPLTDARTGQVVLVPSDRAFFPRSRWQLVGEDEAALAFVRRVY